MTLGVIPSRVALAMSITGRRNPGPAAADENRRRLVAAATELFESDGLNVRFTSIASRAKVGQASLYRHFPDRAAIAWGIFDEHLRELESLALTMSVIELLRAHTEQLIRTARLAQSVSSLISKEQLGELESRFRASYARALGREQPSGVLSAGWTIDDVLLVVRMLTGVLADTPPGRRRAVAAHAWRLLGLPGRFDSARRR